MLVVNESEFFVLGVVLGDFMYFLLVVASLNTHALQSNRFMIPSRSTAQFM